MLQAADIAIYHARYVPVGKDQAAHLELAREIVRAWNARYGEYFVEAEAVFNDSPIVRGTDGVNKMSKSLGNVIDIFAEPEVIQRQVMSMVTDTERIRRTDPGRPEVCNVCQLHRFFSPTEFEAIWDGERTARTGCVDTKRLLADRIVAHFAEARERRRELAERARVRRGGPAGRGRAAGAPRARDAGRLPRADGAGTHRGLRPARGRRGRRRPRRPERSIARRRLTRWSPSRPGRERR